MVAEGITRGLEVCHPEERELLDTIRELAKAEKEQLAAEAGWKPFA